MATTHARPSDATQDRCRARIPVVELFEMYGEPDIAKSAMVINNRSLLLSLILEITEKKFIDKNSALLNTQRKYRLNITVRKRGVKGCLSANVTQW